MKKLIGFYILRNEASQIRSAFAVQHNTYVGYRIILSAEQKNKGTAVDYKRAGKLLSVKGVRRRKH